jgi:4-amino-4-deoxy-L-arabinose transferase-like glycosyltransferase
MPRAARLTVVALVAAILYLPGLGSPPLWEPDEGRYAEVAREMLESGDLLTPRNNYVRYFEKPPLVYWLTAAAMRALGATELAARLPAALATIAQALIVAMLAEAMFGARLGLIAGLAFASTPLIIGFARFATLDPPLALFVTAALAAFYRAACAPRFDRGAGRSWFCASAALLALGTLAKGPVALVLGGGAALTWLIWERRTPDVRTMPWLAASALYLAIAAPWFIAVSARNPEFLSFFFIREHLLRFHESAEHVRPLLFFVPIVVGGMFPWSFFAPLGWLGLRASAAGDPAARSAFRFLLAWFLFVFVFFSLPQSKLGGYILPAIPPAAIICACGVARLADLAADSARRVLAYFAATNFAAAAIAAATLIVMRSRVSDDALWAAALVIASFPLAGALAFALWRYSRSAVLVAGAIVAALDLGVVGAGRIRADVAHFNSYRNLALNIRPALERGCTLASYRHFVQSLPFYTGAREAIVGHRGELAAFSRDPDSAPWFIPDDAELSRRWSSSECIMLIVNRVDLPRLIPKLDPPPVLAACEGKKFALSNRAPDSPPPPDCRLPADLLPPPSARSS